MREKGERKERKRKRKKKGERKREGRKKEAIRKKKEEASGAPGLGGRPLLDLLSDCFCGLPFFGRQVVGAR